MKQPLNTLTLALGLALSSPVLMAAQVPADTALAEKQHLVRANGAEPQTLDPGFVSSGGPGDVIVNDMFEGLVIEDLQGNVIPGQAESWQISEDGTQLTFTLRDKLTWSDGEPLTAEDFVFAWRRAVDPASGNSTGFNLVTANILNADSILKGEKPADSLGVSAADARTLQVSLSQPTPYFVSMLSIKTFAPVPQHQVEAHGDRWTRPENFVSNGAYTLKQWVPNELVEVTRNAKYHADQETVINGVTYLALASQTAELNRYQAGEIHMTNRVQLEQYQRLMKQDPEQIQALRLLGSYVYAFNTKVAPFDNPDIRRALSMAVDRDILIEKVTGQGEPIAYAVVPDIIPDYQSPQPDFAGLSQAERMEEAKALLAKAGFGADNPLKVPLLYNTSENHKKIALAIAAMWKPLGVTVELTNMEWNAYLSTKSEGDFTLARSFAFGDYPEPSSLLGNFTCGHVANETGYCDDAYDALMAKAGKTADQAERYAIYAEAETMLNQAMPVLPLHHYNHTRLVSTKLKGFPENNPKGNIYAKDMFFIQ